jgi:integrase
MAILAECPMCHNKQSTRNKVCSGKNGCGLGLDKAKRSKKVKYWIQYRLPGGKQRKEFVSYSIEEARDADGKRRVQKRENRIFDMLPEANMTFNELAEWYLNLKSVKRLASHKRVVWCIDTFNEVFGNQRVSEIKPVRLEEFQDKCEDDGLAPATIDLILTIVGTAVRKAWDNDMVNGRAVKTFRKVKNKLKAGSNARDRTLALDEYMRLQNHVAAHLKSMLIVAYHTGMRQGELLKLKWSYIDREKGFIRLPAEITKERKFKSIPINHHVKKALESIPRALHHDFVFTYHGKPIGAKIRNAFKGSCKRAGIPYGTKVENGIRFHDIRTTFKTNLLRAGIDKVLRDTIFGHSLQGMDAYYLKPSDGDLREAVTQFTEWIDAQIANVTQSVTQEGKSG